MEINIITKKTLYIILQFARTRKKPTTPTLQDSIPTKSTICSFFYPFNFFFNSFPHRINKVFSTGVTKKKKK